MKRLIALLCVVAMMAAMLCLFSCGDPAADTSTTPADASTTPADAGTTPIVDPGIDGTTPSGDNGTTATTTPSVTEAPVETTKPPFVQEEGDNVVDIENLTGGK